MLTRFQEDFLEKRGIPAEERERFVKAEVAELREPGLLKGVLEAAALIEAAIAADKHIWIVGDFDADGVTSTALLLLALKQLGAKNLNWYINSRFELGYGFQVGTLEEMALQGAIDLIITVDNGISALEAVREARARGIDVIVTDHHDLAAELPDANVIINPKQPDCLYPDKNLAGVGVAFKLVQQLFNGRKQPRQALMYLDLAAMGTVADVMTLVGENRIIVKNGLTLMNWPQARAGIKAIKQVFKISGDIRAYHLGFMFGPALNAQGRIVGIPTMAIELLTTRDAARAEKLAEELHAINCERQELTKAQVEQAMKYIGLTEKRFIVYYEAELHEGIVGLIAGRVKEKYGVPTLVLTTDKEAGLVKGSARSVSGFDIKENLIDGCADLLVRGGGHAMAAGVSLKEENIPALEARLLELAQQYPEEVFHPEPGVDFVMKEEEFSLQLVDEIEALAPFGTGFPSPLFKLEQFFVQKKMYMGKEKQHVKLVGERGVELVAFGQAQLYRTAGEPNYVGGIGHPVKNEWQGRSSLQFNIKGEHLIVL
ncbi:single-stranded-DNA-specific exonuclease RecJ [Azotosporobacter soli]|uniref:single-stranded-DNA-specific exonuclease RecJ n=1 Tax=Azotosporobacter soli TaxID=3055040 RepID=UPI0031FE932F